MGLRDIVVGARAGSSACRYERLSHRAEEKAKRASVRLRGIRLSRTRRLTLKAFSVVAFTSRVVKICNEIVTRLSVDHGVCPNMIFATHWGLPALSHSSLKCARNRRVLC